MDTPRSYEATYRVRFDEADATGHLRPSGLLRYAQDVAWQHSEAAGFDRDWYDARGTLWLVRMATLRLQGVARYGDHLRAITKVTAWRRMWVRRRTRFVGSDGEAMAEVDTDWVLVTTAGRPTRIPDEISHYFAPGSRYKRESVSLDPSCGDARSFELDVRAALVDPMAHLNHAAYLDVVDEAVMPLASDAFRATDYRIEYVRPALAGTSLRVRAWSATHGSYACQMLDQEGAESCRAMVR